MSVSYPVDPLTTAVALPQQLLQFSPTVTGNNKYPSTGGKGVLHRTHYEGATAILDQWFPAAHPSGQTRRGNKTIKGQRAKAGVWGMMTVLMPLILHIRRVYRFYQHSYSYNDISIHTIKLNRYNSDHDSNNS